MNKYLNEIDYKDIFLICNIQEQNNNQNNSTTTIKFSSWKDKIKIENLNYQFDLEEHFIYLLTNEDHEFFKDFELQRKNLIIAVGYANESMNELEREKMLKIRSSLVLCQNKFLNVTNDLNKYKDLVDGINANNKINEDQEVYLFLNYLNALLLVNSQDEDDNILGNPNDNSVRLK
jgi:hypothetical protein